VNSIPDVRVEGTSCLWHVRRVSTAFVSLERSQYIQGIRQTTHATKYVLSPDPALGGESEVLIDASSKPAHRHLTPKLAHDDSAALRHVRDLVHQFHHNSNRIPRERPWSLLKLVLDSSRPSKCQSRAAQSRAVDNLQKGL